MVEFALVLPILLLLALGIVDFGRAINYWNDTNQIAADAARFAAVNKNPATGNADCPGSDGADFTDFRDWIAYQAETCELREGTVAGGEQSSSIANPLQVFICAGSGVGVGNPITIVVKSSYNLIPFLDDQGDNTFGSVSLTGKAVMRLEQPYTLSTLDPASACE